MLPGRRHLLAALRMGSRPVCNSASAWYRWIGATPALAATLATMQEQLAQELNDCKPRAWCHPDSLAMPGAVTERVRYQDAARRVLPRVPGGELRDGDLIAGRWCVELSRIVAPSYATTSIERAQTWLRVTWADAPNVPPVEVTGSDPGTGRPWNGSLFPFPLQHPTIAARTISVRWIFVAQGQDGANSVRPLGSISPVALPECSRVPACPSVVPEWSDNRRGFHRSVDREQHIVSNTPAVCRMFAVIRVTSEDPEAVVASVEVGARLQAVTVQQGPHDAGVRAAVVRS